MPRRYGACYPVSSSTCYLFSVKGAPPRGFADGVVQQVQDRLPAVPPEGEREHQDGAYGRSRPPPRVFPDDPQALLSGGYAPCVDAGLASLSPSV